MRESSTEALSNYQGYLRVRFSGAASVLFILSSFHSIQMIGFEILAPFVIHNISVEHISKAYIRSSNTSDSVEEQ